MHKKTLAHAHTYRWSKLCINIDLNIKINEKKIVRRYYENTRRKIYINVLKNTLRGRKKKACMVLLQKHIMEDYWHWPN